MSAKARAALAAASITGCIESAAAISAFTSGTPTVMAMFSILFLSTCKREAMDSLRWSTSFCSAAFSSHALRERSTDCLTKSTDPARRRMVSDSRMPVMPSSESVSFMSAPASLLSWMPCSSAVKAVVAFSRHAVANCSADIPAASANACNWSPPEETALPIFTSVWLIAEPPISALMPSEDMAPDRPRISALDIPACVPADAKRCAMAETSDSVVAMLLPMATMVEP